MDSNGQITEELKNKVYNKIMDVMLTSLENGTLTAEESEDASYFILEMIDSLPSKNHLDAFLEELSERWECFKPLLQPQHEEELKASDEQNIQNIKEEINQLT